MKRSDTLFLACCCLILSFGCGDSEETSDSISDSTVSDAVNETPEYTLYASDTISSDLLVDYGIFTVDDISASSSGYIALLDGSKATVTLLDTSGTVHTVGGSGSGPGEYQWPKAIAVSDNGSMAVSDFAGGFVRILDPGLDSYVDMYGFVMSNPGKMVLLDSGDLVGMRIIFTSDDGQTSIGHQTALWRGTDPDPSTVYVESMRPFDLNDFGWSLIAPYPMTAGPDGVVYTADLSMDRYVLTSYAPDGTELWSVQRPFEKTEKTQEELDTEREMVSRLMQQTAHQADYTPNQYHFAVSDLSLGPRGNLWARRPGSDSVSFDVYNPSTGEFLYSASAGSEYQLLEVTPAGILAVLPGASQSLLLLEANGEPNF